MNKKGPRLVSATSDPWKEVAQLVKNIKNFFQFNKQKISFLHEQLPPRKQIVFDLVPLLIHLEAQDILPRFETWKRSPFGLQGFRPTARVVEALKAAFPNSNPQNLRQTGPARSPASIQSLALIGSLGSVAQNSKSDFDFWIALDNSSADKMSLAHFQRKLIWIERWAEDFGGAELHFFPLSVHSIQTNDFGTIQGESSGSAQGKLLKEEFYRTMTLVAGRAPVWWAMPPRVGDEEYARLAQGLKSALPLEFDRLIDLGNVSNISSGDLYGAAIWQINKTIGSPFKSVLKLALLEEYLFDEGQHGLLCDELKERVIRQKEPSGFVDPYLLLFDRVSTYIQGKGLAEDLELLRRSLYLKAGVKVSSEDFRKPPPNRKKEIILELIRRWGWDLEAMKSLNDYHLWTCEESLAFSQAINSFVFRTYKRISAQVDLKKEKNGLAISQWDLELLRRKLYIFYSRRQGKVDSVRSVIEAPPVLSSLTLQIFTSSNGKKVWGAFRGMASRERVEHGNPRPLLIQESDFLEGLVIWLVNNRLFGPQTSINLNPPMGEDEFHVTLVDVQHLLKELESFFPVYRYGEIQPEALMNPPFIERMFLIINLEEPDGARHINQIRLCFQNNWGEIFFKGDLAAHEALKLVRDFLAHQSGPAPQQRENLFKIFVPERQNRSVLNRLLNKYFGVALPL